MQSLHDYPWFVMPQQGESLSAAEEMRWEWMSALVFAQVVDKERDHLLVRVRKHISLHAVVTACRGYHVSACWEGSAVQHPVVRLCWALVVQALYGWSWRTLESRLRTDLVVRWCVGYALHEEIPDHTTLWRFPQWMQMHAPGALLATIVAQIVADFPEEATAPQIGDTFALRAKVADVGLTTLLRQCCRRLLAALEASAPDAYAACVAHLGQAELFGTADETPEHRLTADESQQRLLVTAQAAQHALAMVQTVLAQQPAGASPDASLAVVRTWCNRLEKILVDEFTTAPLPTPKSKTGKGKAGKSKKQRSKKQRSEEERSEEEKSEEAKSEEGRNNGQPASHAQAIEPADATVTAQPAALTGPPAPGNTALRRCTKDERGRYRIISAVDPDATLRVHGERIDIGYNIAVATTTRFIHWIAAHTGALPDGATVAPLIATQRMTFGRVPPRLIFDQAAGTPKHMADVASASHGATQLVARLIPYSKRHTRFGPADFTLGQHGQLTCPNNQVSTRFYRSPNGDGWTYRFFPDQCQGCPLTDRCRGDAVAETSHRQVFLSNLALHQRHAIAYLDTPAAAADFAQRHNVERIIAALVRHNGARRARACGLPKVDFQVKLAAVAYNLKRWHTLTRQPSSRRSASPDDP